MGQSSVFAKKGRSRKSTRYDEGDSTIFDGKIGISTLETVP